jgi:hypothetical protein
MISLHGYTRLAGSSTILMRGPFGSCKTPTAALDRWRRNQVFASASESVVRVRAIPSHSGGSRSMTSVVPVRHLLRGHGEPHLIFYEIVGNMVPQGRPCVRLTFTSLTYPWAIGQLCRALNSENTRAAMAIHPSVPPPRNKRMAARRNLVLPRFGSRAAKKLLSFTGWDEGRLGADMVNCLLFYAIHPGREI